MKITVIGAGAIGGMLGAKLSLAGEAVTFVELNRAHADAIARDGLRVVDHDGNDEYVAREVKVTGDVASPGPQDLVIVAVKAQQIPGVAATLRPLLGPKTMVMTVQNGVPWWYFYKTGGPFDGRRIEAIDPGGEIDKHIEVERIVGCVVYPAGEVIAPGVIKHVEGDRYSVGELDGAQTERIKTLSETLQESRVQVIRPRGHSLRDLVEAVGQSLVQSDQRADPRDARRHLPLPADARSCGEHDARSASDRREIRDHVPAHDRKTHRRRRERRRA